MHRSFKHMLSTHQQHMYSKCGQMLIRNKQFVNTVAKEVHTPPRCASNCEGEWLEIKMKPRCTGCRAHGSSHIGQANHTEFVHARLTPHPVHMSLGFYHTRNTSGQV
eukprot:1151365-Pelagomonas_calceolata.AAC.2